MKPSWSLPFEFFGARASLRSVNSLTSCSLARIFLNGFCIEFSFRERDPTCALYSRCAIIKFAVKRATRFDSFSRIFFFFFWQIFGFSFLGCKVMNTTSKKCRVSLSEQCVLYVLCVFLCTRKRGRLWTPKTLPLYANPH
jgi:hypothetical protein